jgi:FAD/FMN-containing dehydrogenase
MIESTSLVEDLRNLIAPHSVLTDADSLINYGQDWTRLYTPNPRAVVLPNNLSQVQRLVDYANEHHLPLVPSGGRTGLSGAAVATNGEVVVSFAKMNRIISFDPINRSVICEPGVVTATLQDFARGKGLFYPVDFAARGSSQIGGNIATNAGGIKVIRYGMTRDWVTGLKVITGKGDLLDLNKGLVKNASGYDLRHLFIGSEGTLGLIVEATLKLTLPPQETNVMVLGVPELEGIMAIFNAFQNRVSLTAFEFFSEQALNHVLAKGLKRPFDTLTPYYVLLEFEKSSEMVMETALETFSYCADQGWLADAVISQSEVQALELWRLREDISESIAHHFPYKNDVSVRVSQISGFLRDTNTLFTHEYPDFQVIWFGHIGDGNLHISVLKPADMERITFIEKCQVVTERLFSIIQKHSGSISAEHGVGLTKKPYLHYTRNATEVSYLRALKQVFDPNHILNPGKIFD